MLATISRHATRKSLVSTVSRVKGHRAFVQPSGADRASIVDVPSTYQDEKNHLSPTPGDTYKTFRRLCLCSYSD